MGEMNQSNRAPIANPITWRKENQSHANSSETAARFVKRTAAHSFCKVALGADKSFFYGTCGMRLRTKQLFPISYENFVAQ
jgi:hypothetical protein